MQYIRVSLRLSHTYKEWSIVQVGLGSLASYKMDVANILYVPTLFVACKILI